MNVLQNLQTKLRVAFSLAASNSDNRWRWIWNAVYCITLLFCATVALFRLDNTSTWFMILLLILVLIGWYWLGEKFRSLLDERYWLWPVAYFGMGWLGWARLTHFDGVFYFLLFGLYAQVVTLTRMRRSMIGMIVLTALITALQTSGGAYSITQSLLTLMSLFTGLVCRFFIDTIKTQSAERQRLIEKLETTRDELATAERQAGVFEERQRLAREIHDTLAQGFASIVIQLEAAEGELPPELVNIHRYLNQARHTARESLGEARRLVWALRPESLDRASLIEALTRLTAHWTDDAGIPARVTTTGTLSPLRPEVEVTFLRAAQEALTNIRKHARASQVTLTLSYMDDLVTLDILDNGVGFDLADLDKHNQRRDGLVSGGFGLQAMRDRVEGLGGTLTIESTPDDGTILALALPIFATPLPIKPPLARVLVYD